jgi:hypothetical protein
VAPECPAGERTDKEDRSLLQPADMMIFAGYLYISTYTWM